MTYDVVIETNCEGVIYHVPLISLAPDPDGALHDILNRFQPYLTGPLKIVRVVPHVYTAP